MSRGRSIRLFLVDGTSGGIITAEIVNWTGHVLVGPRSRLPNLIQREEAGRAGVYFLTGPDPNAGGRFTVYVGETENVGKRLAQHNRDEDKDFWDRVCIVTSKDLNLTKAHIRYLESRLISVAAAAARSSIANGTAPGYELLPEADKNDMEEFLEQIRTVLPVLGFDFLRSSAAALISQEQQQAVAADAALPPLSEAAPIAPDQAGAPSRNYRPRHRPTSTGIASPVFELKDARVGLTARAIEADGEMIVLAGSQARKIAGTSLTGTAQQKRQELIEAGIMTNDPENPDVYKFAVDTPINSPSQASSLILARSDNGRKSWVIESTTKTYAAWQEEQVSAVEPPENVE